VEFSLASGFQEFDSFASRMRWGSVLLKCEVIRVLLNIGQKISRKQYVSIILTIHFNAGINEVKVCSSKCRHTNRHHDRFAVRWPSAEKTISCDREPVDYKIWGILQERVYRTSSKDVDELRRRIAEEWGELDHRTIDKAVGEWGKRLQACVAAGEDTLNTRCNIYHLLYFVSEF